VSTEEKLSILKEVLGLFHREGTKQTLFHCPKCNHHKKKLSVNLEKGYFKCWICDWSGKSLYRIIKTFGTYHQKQDWRRLHHQTEINDFAEKLFGVSPAETLLPINLPETFTSLVGNKNSSTSMRPLNYLRSRGVDKKDIYRWKIGYCYEGKYAGRVVFPSFNIKGELDYYVSRTYDKNWIKYLNPPTRKNIIFNELYLDFEEDLVIVEGVFDAIKASSNAVPLLGSTLTEDSRLFKKIVENDSRVYLALDADANRKSDKITKLLLEYDIETHMVDMGTYDDPASMTKEEFFLKKQDSTLLNTNNYLLSRILRI
jgi:DNA primase